MFSGMISLIVAAFVLIGTMAMLAMLNNRSAFLTVVAIAGASVLSALQGWAYPASADGLWGMYPLLIVLAGGALMQVFAMDEALPPLPAPVPERTGERVLDSNVAAVDPAASVLTERQSHWAYG